MPKRRERVVVDDFVKRRQYELDLRNMGYTAAAFRTLQAIKETLGGDLDASNEVKLRRGHAFLERGEEQADGAIVGMVQYVAGGPAVSFRINADGSIAKFPGIPTFRRRKIEWLVAHPDDYHPKTKVW